MKKPLFLVIFCLSACGVAVAQSKLPELDKIKQIKLLESTRENVKWIFSKYKEDFEEEEAVKEDFISTGKIRLFFRYSLGNCSDDDDQEWNVPQGIVTEINVILADPVKSKDLKIDLKKLERINKYEADEKDEEDPDAFVYYDKNRNVSYGLEDGEIENIKFTPAEKNFPALCANETVREFISNKEWLTNKLKGRYLDLVACPARPNVSDVLLSRTEITANCAVAANESVCTDDAEISVETIVESIDPYGILNYHYTVSGGKIIGKGANVRWDLSGVKPGRHIITAAADNGGIAGMTKTKEVVVRECPDCPKKENK